MKHSNIPVFVPHSGCPFDCVFCNQKHITGITEELKEEEIVNIIEEHLKTLPAGCKKEIAFFGGSFTGIDGALQEKYLSIAYRYVKCGSVSGIRLSTRPDYIDDTVLKRLSRFGVKVIELGVQSMDSEVLKKSGRGHSAEDVEKAAELIKSYGFSLGLQMMTGLPGDTPEKSIYTCERIIALKPDCVRIYPTLVIEDTALLKLYREGKYKPQTLEEAVELSARLLDKFNRANIKVIRVSLAVTDEISPGGKLVAGPFHSAFRELVEGRIYYKKIEKEMPFGKNVTIRVNPREISKVIGNKKENKIKLEEKFGSVITVVGDGRFKRGNYKLYI